MCTLPSQRPEEVMRDVTLDHRAPVSKLDCDAKLLPNLTVCGIFLTLAEVRCSANTELGVGYLVRPPLLRVGSPKECPPHPDTVLNLCVEWTCRGRDPYRCHHELVCVLTVELCGNLGRGCPPSCTRVLDGPLRVQCVLGQDADENASDVLRRIPSQPILLRRRRNLRASSLPSGSMVATQNSPVPALGRAPPAMWGT